VKAIVIEQYCGPQVLQLKKVDLGNPEPSQVLVRLAMAGVNFVDIYQRSGPITENCLSFRAWKARVLWKPSLKV
jgi:NADPH:quinone reductase-like Zn-dependent oxidoreductase